MVDGQNGVLTGIVVSPVKVAHRHEVGNAIHPYRPEAQNVTVVPQKQKDVMGIHVLVWLCNSYLYR